jgi:hypothetical protein
MMREGPPEGPDRRGSQRPSPIPSYAQGNPDRRDTMTTNSDSDAASISLKVVDQQL